MKQIKRWISSLLVLCMVLSMIPVTAHAETASGTCGENLTWTLSDDGVLTISGTGPMEDYTSRYGVPWFSIRSSISSIIIENGVTTIGSHAFAYCNLTSMEIPNSVTSIGYEAFYECDRLTNIDIGDSVTTIGDYAFAFCDSLSNVVIPDSVTTIGGEAFYYCSSLTSVEIPDSVTSIGGSAFAYCSSLSSVEIPDSVTTIGNSVFYDCDSLSSVVIPDSVTTIGNYAFGSCDSLSSVEIPDSVTTIGNYAFYDCDSLSSVVIGDSVTTISEWAFRSCDSLKEIKFTGDAPTIASNTFLDVTAAAYYPADNPTWTADKLQNYGGTITWVPNEVENDGEGTESAGDIRFFREWDVENQIAYWGETDYVGSQVTEETDTSFLENVDQLVGQYVLVETKSRDDNFVGPDTLISITPLETKIGTVTEITDSTLEIDGSVYSTPSGLFAPDIYKGKLVLYHLNEGEFVGIELLEWEVGALQFWSTTTRELQIDPEGVTTGLSTYLLSDLADDESTVFLGNTGHTNVNVRYATDGMDFVYRIGAYTPAGSPDYYDTYIPPTEEQEIFYQLAEDWMKAYETFAAAADRALRAFAGSDEENRELIISRQAAAMKANDEHSTSQYLTGNLGAYADEAYHALATFFYDYTESNAEFSSVDLSGTMAEVTIINNVISAMWKESKEYIYENVTIEITASGYGSGSAFGKLYICPHKGDPYSPVIVCSTQSDCETAVAAFVNELKDLATNATYNMTSAIYKDILGKPISALTKEYVSQTIAGIERKFAVKAAEIFPKAGVGNIIHNLDECYTYYSYVYKAANSGDLNDLQTSIQTVLGFDLKFEDKSIKDAATNKAMKGLKKAVKAMLNAYEDYLEDLASGGKTVHGSYQINCPVNVSVYNSAGECIGYAGTDDIWYSEEIRIRDLGGAKQILVYSDDILSFEMVATNYGTMNCSFEEYDENGLARGRLNYYDIVLAPEQTFNLTLQEDLKANQNDVYITTGNTSISADEYISVNDDAGIEVKANPEDGGSVIGVGTHVRGDAVVMHAIPSEGYKFAGWYENDTMVCVSETYEFTATKNRDLVAKFYFDNYIYITAKAGIGGTVVGNGRYADGATATVIAVAEDGFEFVGWFIDGVLVSENSEYQFSATDNITLVAKFECSSHSMTCISFTWSEDFSTCKATASCPNCNTFESIDCTITSETTPATETADGQTVYTATVEFNGQTYTDTKIVEIPATGHVTHITTLVPAVEADCTNPGNTAYYTCSGCDVWFEDEDATVVIEDHDSVVVLAMGHTEEVIPGKDASCTESGLTEGKKCTVCGETLVAQEEISAKGHTYESVVTAPTCTEQGCTTHTCAACGDSYVDSYVDATGHSYSDVTVFAWGEGYETCTAGFVCGTCGEQSTAECTVTSESRNATCTEPGTVVYTATVTVNGVTYTDEKTVENVALGHLAGETVRENEIPATCTNEGSYEEVVSCERCGAEISRTKLTVEKLPHTGETIPGKDATCTETGLTEGQKCAVCGETLVEQEEIPAKGHSYEHGFCTECGDADPNYEEPADPSDPSETVPSTPVRPSIPNWCGWMRKIWEKILEPIKPFLPGFGNWYK